MAKNLDPNKLLVGVKKDFKKDHPVQQNNVDSIIEKIHQKSADEKKKNQLDYDSTVRTTLDIPKQLHKQIRLKIVDVDLSLKDYLLGLAKKDLGLQ